MSKTCSESDDTAIDASVSGAEIFFLQVGSKWTRGKPRWGRFDLSPMMPVMPTDINWILKLGLQVCSASSGHSVDPVRLWQAANPGNVASNPAGRWAQGVDLHPDDQDAGRAGVLPQLPWLCVHAACKY